MREGTRAVSPVVSTILMVAVAVVVGTLVITLAFGLGETVDDPGPVVGESTGELTAGSDRDTKIVTVRHVAGDAIEAENMAIEIDATDACGQRARILNLPATQNVFGPKLSDENVRASSISDSIVSGSPVNALTDFELGVLHAENDNTFRAGSFFEFRITNDCDIEPGETITVRVVHTPSNAVVIEKRLRAE